MNFYPIKKSINILNYENLWDDKNMSLKVFIIKLALLNIYSNRAQKENRYNKFNDFDMIIMNYEFFVFL